MPTAVGRHNLTNPVFFLTGGVEIVQVKKCLQEVSKRKQIFGRKTIPQEEGVETLSDDPGGKGGTDTKLHPAAGVPRAPAPAVHNVQTDQSAGIQ